MIEFIAIAILVIIAYVIGIASHAVGLFLRKSTFWLVRVFGGLFLIAGMIIKFVAVWGSLIAIGVYIGLVASLLVFIALILVLRLGEAY